MKAKRIAVFIGAVAGMLTWGCKKDIPVPSLPTPDPTPQSVYDYGFFSPGTYWIYQDSVSGNTDSVYVIYGRKGKDTLDLGLGDGTKIYDMFEVKMHSSFEDYDYYLWYNATWSGKNPRRDKLFFTKSRPGNYVGEIILCELPPTPGNVLYWYGDNTITTLDFYSTYLSNVTQFASVIKVGESKDAIQSHQPSCYFISKNFGIIRKEYLDSNSIWKLVRHNIVQ